MKPRHLRGASTSKIVALSPTACPWVLYIVPIVPEKKWVLCSTGPVLPSTRQGN